MRPLDDTTMATVTRLQRTPVHASTLVRSDAAHTFDTFVTSIGAWWPVDPFSGGRDRVLDVTVERSVGGRVYETWDDGTTVDWGDIGTWEPPERFVMSWRGTPVPTEVELSFTALGPSLTRVTVEHRGWDALSDEELAADCALPGGYSGGAYDIGWSRILDAFAIAIGDERRGLPTITDNEMRNALGRSKSYTLMLLAQGPEWSTRDREKVVWEHGRRNFALRADGVLPIVCPITDASRWCGIGLFNTSPDEVVRIMEDDPGVRAGVFDYEVHPVRGFPRDALPE
jgi:Activator of Hsp90 ATPase homolog 1-like protein